MKRVLEIRAAEGGEDSKLFVQDLAQSYLRMSVRLGWTSNIICNSANEVHIEIKGKELDCLENEIGGHRIQRIPPTEKKGRVHTSTVTVAVLDTYIPEIKLNEQDLKIEWYSGTGCGGQHRNKHDNSCRLTHLPSGVVVTSQCSSRQTSYNEALTVIKQRVNGSTENAYLDVQSKDRKVQVGSGQRGDKIRTYRFQDNSVHDHITGKRANCDKVLKGHFDLLW